VTNDGSVMPVSECPLRPSAREDAVGGGELSNQVLKRPANSLSRCAPLDWKGRWRSSSTAPLWRDNAPTLRPLLIVVEPSDGIYILFIGIRPRRRRRPPPREGLRAPDGQKPLPRHHSPKVALGAHCGLQSGSGTQSRSRISAVRCPQPPPPWYRGEGGTSQRGTTGPQLV